MAQCSLKVNAILNGIRQICAILFPLITFPYISRILGSDGFGKYNFSQSITSYFILLAALGINTYAIREGAKIRDNKEKITKFCSQVFSINIISSLLSLVALGILLLVSTKVRNYTPYILIESTAIVMSTVGVNWINNIYEDFLYLTIRYILIQVVALVAMFVFVKQPSDIIPYCIISVLATNGGNLINIFYVRRYVIVKFIIHMNLKEHLKPLLILFVNSIAVIVYVNSDITMLGFYENDSIVGVYSFVSKIYNILKQLINAVVIVSLPRIAYILKNRSEQYDEYISKIFKSLNFCMLPIIIGVMFMSDAMIMIAGGEEYLTGNNSLKVLSIAMLFAIYSSLVTNCILIVNQQEKKCLSATVLSAVVNVILNFVLLPIIGIMGAAITTVIAEALNCLIQMWYSRPYYNLKKLDIKGNIPCIIGTILVSFVCVACNSLIDNMIVRLLIAILISGLVYIISFLAFKNIYPYRR